MFNEADLTALVITLKLAFISTFVLLLLGTPLAFWLARTRWRFKFLLEAMIALPLVLPPTVLGFYLLVLLGPKGFIGGLWVDLTGSTLTFSFTGLVIASVVYSLPFVVQPLQNAFEAVGRKPLEAAWTLGASKWDAFFTVAAPMALRGFLTAITLGFAHTLGEFGVVLMVGGNIPGETKVISIAVYEHVEVLEYTQAHLLSLILLGISFSVLFTVYALNRHLAVKAG